MRWESRIEAPVLIRTHSLRFQGPNSQSKLLNMISILNVHGDQNYNFWKLFTIFSDRYKIAVFIVQNFLNKNNFVPYLKKFPEKLKFGLQAHFKMEIMLNGSDQLFGL